jgi:hypothetical protein
VTEKYRGVIVFHFSFAMSHLSFVIVEGAAARNDK